MKPKPKPKPRLLDAFCGAGGAAVGYMRAGFEVIGVDLVDQPNYPFEFHRADALDVLESLTELGTHFDAIHASPPCQHSSALTKGTNRLTKAQNHFDLIPQTRVLLEATGLPWVIENVQGSQLRRDLTLCGEMFGLDVIRHRYFELGNWSMPKPAHVPHRGRVAGWRHGVHYDGPYVAVYGDGGGKGTVAQWQAAMGGIYWSFDRKEIAEMIPPQYTEFVGHGLITHLKASK